MAVDGVGEGKELGEVLRRGGECFIEWRVKADSAIVPRIRALQRHLVDTGACSVPRSCSAENSHVSMNERVACVARARTMARGSGRVLLEFLALLTNDTPPHKHEGACPHAAPPAIPGALSGDHKIWRVRGHVPVGGETAQYDPTAPCAC